MPEMFSQSSLASPFAWASDAASGTASERDDGLGAEASLKNLVQAATGVSVDCQKLMFGGHGELLDHDRAICDYDIGHGALLYLSVRRPRRGKKESSPKFLAGPVLAGMHGPDFINDRVVKFAKGWVGSNMGADLVELLPTWQDPMCKTRPDDPELLTFRKRRDTRAFHLSDNTHRKFDTIARLTETSPRR